MCAWLLGKVTLEKKTTGNPYCACVGGCVGLLLAVVQWGSHRAERGENNQAPVGGF